MSLEQDLLNLKSKADKLNVLKIETSTKLDLLSKERDLLLQECVVLGVDPQKISEVVLDEENKLQQEITTLTQQLDAVFNDISKL